MTRRLRRADHCLNCGTAVQSNYCPECGQENSDYRVSLRPLLGELTEELFQLESRIWRSLAALLLRPGRLSVEYNQGRRVRYTSPLRLYLVASVAYFFIAGLVPSKATTVHLEPIDAAKFSQELEHEQTGWKRRLLTKVIDLSKADLTVANQRIQRAMLESLPKTMAVLVPLFALLMKLFYRRRFYVEHLVFALHAHAFGFLLLIPTAWAGHQEIELAVLLLVLVYAVLAARRAYGETWPRTVGKLAGVGFIYSMVLGLGVAGVTVLALLSA